MKNISEIINEINDTLSVKEKQLLAVVILTCYWGDSTYAFIENGEKDEYPAELYTLDDVEENLQLYNIALSSRQISGTFSSMFKKLCPSGIGEYISHDSDFWGDDSGPVICVRSEIYDSMRNWAEQCFKA